MLAVDEAWSWRHSSARGQGQLQFSDWDTALRTAIGLAPRGGDEPASGAAGPSRLLVIDELPYLVAHSPELPSILQELYDETDDDPKVAFGINAVFGGTPRW